MTDDDPVAAFRVEASEVLDEVEQALLDLGARLDDATLVNAVFRGLHTVKGSGAMFGFDALAAFTHHCETAFDKVRKGKAFATAELVSAVLAACDHMRVLLTSGAVEPGAGEALLDRLARSLDSADSPVAVSPTNGDWQLAFHLAPDAMANGVNPLAMLAELRELGATDVVALMDRIPPLGELDVVDCHVGWQMHLPADVSRDAIEDVFLFVLDDMDLELSCPEGDAALDDAAGQPAQPTGAPPPRAADRAAEETVRVPAGRLDELMNRVGELVIAQSRLSQIAGQREDLALRSVSEEIERLAGELRTTMMVLRMVPVAHLFGRFRRLVHDLGRETGKQFVLETDGEGTEVDKTVAEALFDPLVHIIRNACDHGLEDAATRAATGKPETGTLSDCHSRGVMPVRCLRSSNCHAVATRRPYWSIIVCGYQRLKMTGDLERLRAFNVLATEGSFARASQVLNMPRSTLAQFVKELESQYGHMLFEQRRHPLHLTDVGREIVELTRRLVNTWEDIETRLRETGSIEDRLIRISSDNPVFAVRLAKALVQSEPRANLELNVGGGNDVMARLIDFQADLVILSDPQIDERFAYRPLFIDQVRIVLPRSHKRADAESFPMKALQGERLLLLDGASKTRSAIESALNSLEILPKQTIYLNSTAAIAEAVAVGLGIGIMFASECSYDTRLINLPTEHVAAQITGYIVCRAKDRQSALVRWVYDAAAVLEDGMANKRTKSRSF